MVFLLGVGLADDAWQKLSSLDKQLRALNLLFGMGVDDALPLFE